MGFSAGGQLASTLETHFDGGHPSAPEPTDRESCRPDFSILAYPAITLKAGEQHQGSKDNLLGSHQDPALVASLSNETQVTPETPPTILFHGEMNSAVPIRNSVEIYEALEKAHVPAEIHTYQHMNHGFGFGATPDRSPRGMV